MFSGCEAFLFPPLSPEYVASTVVSGVLAEREEVIIPGVMGIIFFLMATLPSKCIGPLLDFAGVRDLMANFQGRKEIKERVHELTSNNNAQ